MSRFVERARALVGCAFRPQGRAIDTGLDCVGLACAVYGIAADEVPRDYRLRGDHRARLLRQLGRFFVRTERASAGDLLVCRVGGDQVHLAVLTDRGFVHADARLRRVVEAPGAVPWPVLSAHRFDNQLQD